MAFDVFGISPGEDATIKLIASIVAGTTAASALLTIKDKELGTTIYTSTITTSASSSGQIVNNADNTATLNFTIAHTATTSMKAAMTRTYAVFDVLITDNNGKLIYSIPFARLTFADVP